MRHSRNDDLLGDKTRQLEMATHCHEACCLAERGTRTDSPYSDRQLKSHREQREAAAPSLDTKNTDDRIQEVQKEVATSILEVKSKDTCI